MKTIEYTPRRASKTRWLEDAPEYILDCFDHPAFPQDRYTVMFTSPLLGRFPADSTRYADTYVFYLSPCGSGEMKAHEAASYRYANGKHRVRWNDLPESFRARVKAWAEQD